MLRVFIGISLFVNLCLGIEIKKVIDLNNDASSIVVLTSDSKLRVYACKVVGNRIGTFRTFADGLKESYYKSATIEETPYLEVNWTHCLTNEALLSNALTYKSLMEAPVRTRIVWINGKRI